MRRGALALALLASTLFAAEAGAETRTAQAGAVHAELVWDAEAREVAPRLKVTREATVSEADVGRCFTSDDGSRYCDMVWPLEEALSVRDLDADGEPEVVVSVFTGGAHCCFDAYVFRWDAARGTYVQASRNFGDVGFRLRDLGDGGPVEWVTHDTRFAYAFGGFGDSRFPVRVLRFGAGGWDDVSGAYPATLRADARRHWRTYRTFRRRGWDCEGVLAAWMADKVRLGEAADGWRRIRAADRRGDLDPGGRRYTRRLRAHLVRFGYL